MNCIRMITQVSTEHFHKAVLCLLLITLVLCSCSTSLNYDAYTYSDTKEVIDLFKSNQSDFEDIVLCLEEKNNIFQEIYSQTEHRCIFSPYQKSLTENADDELKKELEDFFLKYKPYSIINKDGYYSFSFITDNEGIGLYKILSEDYDGVKNHISSYGACVSIDDNWLYVIYEK